MSDLRLRAGTSVLNNGGTVHPAVSFSIHPEFDKNSFAYDLALIQVSPEFKYDSLRQPVFLPTKEPDENSMGTVSGWGPTQVRNFFLVQYPRVILKNKMSILGKWWWFSSAPGCYSPIHKQRNMCYSICKWRLWSYWHNVMRRNSWERFLR